MSKCRAERPTDGADLARREFLWGWIGPREAMRHLGLGSLSALYRLINEHNLPYGRAGKQYRFRRADLDEWMAVRSPEHARSADSPQVSAHKRVAEVRHRGQFGVGRAS